MESVLAVSMLFNMSHDILSDDAVQRMLRDGSEHFDLVMMEPSGLEALYGLVEYYNATLIGLSGGTVSWKTEALAGNPAPSIYEPISPIGYSWNPSFMSKIYNWIHITEEKLLEGLIVRPAQLRLFKKIFGYSDLKFNELRRKFSVILINNHFSMGRVRANVPNIIEVGGLHLSEPRNHVIRAAEIFGRGRARRHLLFDGNGYLGAASARKHAASIDAIICPTRAEDCLEE